MYYGPPLGWAWVNRREFNLGADSADNPFNMETNTEGRYDWNVIADDALDALCLMFEQYSIPVDLPSGAQTKLS
jgi:hypothetical protein